MFTPLHPRWGRLIGALDATPNTIRLVLSADDERSGREALENICHQATMPIRDRGQDIDISALDSSLRLAQDPKTIRHLAHPLVISGCIKLLGAAVAQRGRFGSPFRYEYGYLCLRLLVASVNVCLLDRYGQLDEALEACEENDQYAADYLASVALASVVESQFQITHNGINTTWDSGWAIPNPEEGPLVPRSDLSTLLGLLWNDRKFIIATSGFSGLLFLLSQHVFQEKYIHKNPDGEKLKRRMYELGLRYLLVAERSQRGVTLRAIDANHPDTEGWSRNAKHVDAEDSRLLMTALIKRLPIGDDRSVFVTREPSVMFRLITISTDPETQDLLPGAIRCAIEYGWAMLFGMNIDLDQRFQGTARTVFGILT
ncbi:unnamed protein product [Rhizoctonia solani]|uniref:Uncharacterized protein n=1 Tax=Rhizoctonia solani TaxID=456999 RepID=A0A8H3DFG0_9AGAM|nr:unnamed protein product [Rhizoctonia solani]